MRFKTCLAALFALASMTQAQVRPYIGFAYPAGAQQGATVQIKLGGQGLDDIEKVLITGTGVSAKVVKFNRPLSPQEITLLNEQLRELKRGTAAPAPAQTKSVSVAPASSGSGPKPVPAKPAATGTTNEQTLKLIASIEKRISEYVNRPASVALASIALLEVTVAADAPPGERELRVGTLRGISNPLVFHVGQLPESSRKPMLTSFFQVLGKEELALRRRPAEEAEQRITLPCTVNGQVSSGELNRYRFEARKGQRLVIATQARQLIPYIADAVPGWFQPVIALYDASGKEVAYDDDFRFKPDPVLYYEVPKDGEYSFVIYDSIYRGREDFVYRITIGEMPYVTSIFPLGGPANTSVAVTLKGWNLETTRLTLPATDPEPSVHAVVSAKQGYVSNRMPFVRDTLPECLDKEANNTEARAQKIKLPVIVNGRIDRPDDWDVFQLEGRAGESIVVEVVARRLDSPLDSIVKLADAKGQLLGLNDDREDPASGVNTHHADSYLMVKLPADGVYYVHLGDTGRQGGEEYAYRLRFSAPQPDFALRVVPSSVNLRSKSSTTVSVHALRKDGFTGPIKLSLKNPPMGFSANPITLSGTQEVARLTVRSDLVATKEPVRLAVMGSARIQNQDVIHEAVPAEDRMQAFLWRHLVPAADLPALVYDPSYQPPPKRIPPPLPPATNDLSSAIAALNPSADKPKFTKGQVSGRLRQLKLLYEEGLLTDQFHGVKVAECEAFR